MRLYTKKYITNDGLSLMHRLSDPHTNVENYRNTFYKLGKILGQAFNSETNNLAGRTMVACASEDADWLVSGVLEQLPDNPSMAVFWNERVKLSNDNSIEISPIIKAYIEPIAECDTLVLVKSIISTSCVVKTQLTRLVNEINPSRIFILSPVMYKDARKSLEKEFPGPIVSKFYFITLAVDDRRDPSGNVLPGIGGMVYPRLGLGDFLEKNNYIPELVKRRMSSE